MLTMAQINDIRKSYFQEGQNISQIAQSEGIDRKTVRKYINEGSFSPRPIKAKERSYKKLEGFTEIIDKWLEEDKLARRKQRHTARRVHQRLTEECACAASYRTVAYYIAGKKKTQGGQGKGYLPLEHQKGEAQVDFGQADYYENGRHIKGYYLNVSFPFSNHGYLQLFPGENEECLFEGLISIFNHIGKTPTRLWFDNPSTIVKKIQEDKERTLTDGFQRFAQHYGFISAFCNPSSGWEKGNVENKVGYHRRNLLVPVPRFKDLATYNRQLLEKCDEDGQREHYKKALTHLELFAQDKAAMLALPEAFDPCRYQILRTDNWGKFVLDTKHWYSVSPRHAKTKVQVKLSATKVQVLDENLREIVSHPRLYGKEKQESMNWIPYLSQLAKSPGALKYTGIYPMLPEPLQKYLEKSAPGEKGKILALVASLTTESSFDNAIAAVSRAACYQGGDVDSLLSVYRRLNETTHIPRVNQNTPSLVPCTIDLGIYDKQLAGVR